MDSELINGDDAENLTEEIKDEVVEEEPVEEETKSGEKQEEPKQGLTLKYCCLMKMHEIPNYSPYTRN